MLQACVLTKLPEAEEPLGRALAKACRKLSRALEPLLLVPPNALTRLLKLLCRLVSALLTALLVELLLVELLDVVSVELDEPDSDWIRFCRSAAIWPGPPPGGGPPMGGPPAAL